MAKEPLVFELGGSKEPSWFKAGTKIVTPGLESARSALEEVEFFAVVSSALMNSCRKDRISVPLFRKRMMQLANAYEAAVPPVEEVAASAA